MPWGAAEYPAVGSISELRVTEAGPSQLRVTWRGLPGVGGYRLTWRGSDGECGDREMPWWWCQSPFPAQLSLLGLEQSRVVPADPTAFTIEGLRAGVYTVAVSAIVDGHEGSPVTATARIGEVSPHLLVPDGATCPGPG